MEITIEVDDIDGLYEYISDELKDKVEGEVEKQMHSEFINNDEFQKSVKSAVLYTLSTDEFQFFIKNAIIHQLESRTIPTYTNKEWATNDTPDFEAWA